MKKLVTIFVCLFLAGATLSAQNLISDVTGKWSITKYQSKAKMQGRSGTLIFSPDGSFQSEGIYFGVQTGLFRTDETRQVLIIETPEGISEWTASVKNDVLRLRSIKGKGPRTYLTLMRLKATDDITSIKAIEK